MRPKEKASELLKKYATFIVMWSGDTETTNENIRQCVLITVNEIIDVYLKEDKDELTPDLQYWYEVKYLINNDEIPKTPDEFNVKYKDYLEHEFYGMEMENEEILKVADEAFKEFIKVPGFKYYQLKNKFGYCRFYADNIDVDPLCTKIDKILIKLKNK